MRVSFAGGGSDVPPFIPGVGGRVVGAAINIRVRVAVEPFDHGWVRIESASTQHAITRRTTDPPRSDVSFRLLEAILGYSGIADGVWIRVESNVTPGAGLGGSGAVAVAALGALHASVGSDIVRDNLYREATRIERDGLRLLCGSQDQIFAAFGGILDLEFDEDGCTRIDPIVVDPELIEGLHAGLLLIDTQVRRVSGEVLDRTDAVAARNSVAELVSAAHEVAKGLREGSISTVLEGMHRNASAKARRDPSANAFAIDLWKVLADRGAQVVRTCGAGAGGHVLVWAPPKHHAEILQTIGPCCVRRPALGAPGIDIDAGSD